MKNKQQKNKFIRKWNKNLRVIKMHREPECGIYSYCISLNNSRGNYFFFRIKRGWLFEGGQLFEILLTGCLALNILFYYHIKRTEHWLFRCSKFGSLINFQSWDRHRSVLLADSSSTWQVGNKRKRGVRGAIMWGRQLIEGWLFRGNTVCHSPLKSSCVPESFWEGFQSDRRWFGFQV